MLNNNLSPTANRKNLNTIHSWKVRVKKKRKVNLNKLRVFMNMSK